MYPPFYFSKACNCNNVFNLVNENRVGQIKMKNFDNTFNCMSDQWINWLKALSCSMILGVVLIEENANGMWSIYIYTINVNMELYVEALVGAYRCCRQMTMMVKWRTNDVMFQWQCVGMTSGPLKFLIKSKNKQGYIFVCQLIVKAFQK